MDDGVNGKYICKTCPVLSYIPRAAGCSELGAKEKATTLSSDGLLLKFVRRFTC